MSNLQSLTTLLAQNERQRDEALAEHQRAQATSEAAQAQSEQLHTYRREYEQRWGEQFKREGKIELVRHYHSFMERLTQAVEQQVRVAQHAAAQVERAAELLRECELRCASVRKLIERRLHAQRASTHRSEQKHSDELASRTSWNHPRSAGHGRLA